MIGVEPGKLAPGSPVDRFSPPNLAGSIGVATATHPAVSTAQYNVDAALLQVKVAEGALYPTLSLQGNVQQSYESSLLQLKTFNASVLGQLSVPIYQGGAEYSLIRQAKETLGQRRLDLDTARDQVRQTVVQSWGQLEAAKANIDATQAQVQASEIALNGVREEARVGQRTTLDVLNAQQELVNARVALVSAQRDRVVASYTLLAAVGRLSPQTLGLRVPVYDSNVHYQQVRDTGPAFAPPTGGESNQLRAGDGPCPQLIARSQLSTCHICTPLAYKRYATAIRVGDWPTYRHVERRECVRIFGV